MSLSGSTSRHCYAIGCTNGDYRLRKWRESLCATHGIFQEKCPCPPPFQLFTFPTERMDKDKRQRWLQKLKRASSATDYKYLEPSKDHRLCSDHFIDGRPTELNPDPILKLGHSSKRPFNASGCEARYAKRLCKTDEETCTAELLTETEDRSTLPSTCYNIITTTSMPVLKAASKFIIYVLLCLIMKYKDHNQATRNGEYILESKDKDPQKEAVFKY